MRIKDHPILSFPEGKTVEFSFEGKTFIGKEGEPIAAALHDAGIRVLRHSPRHNRPRGFFCAIGNCSSCLMVVNGEPNVKVCVTPLRQGMKVEYQKGKGDINAAD